HSDYYSVRRWYQVSEVYGRGKKERFRALPVIWLRLGGVFETNLKELDVSSVFCSVAHLNLII
ncbi:MAG: hypothetical protein JSW59_08620, partial [Phycisphaerales bacterium]